MQVGTDRSRGSLLRSRCADHRCPELAPALDSCKDDCAFLRCGAVVPISGSAKPPTFALVDLAADVGRVGLNLSRKRAGVVLPHQVFADQVEHPQSGLLIDADLAFEVFRGDTALRARDEIDRVEPKMQRGRGLVEDRPRRRMDVVSAGGTRPRLAALLRLVPLERAHPLALRWSSCASSPTTLPASAISLAHSPRRRRRTRGVPVRRVKPQLRHVRVKESVETPSGVPSRA